MKNVNRKCSLIGLRDVPSYCSANLQGSCENCLAKEKETLTAVQSASPVNLEIHLTGSGSLVRKNGSCERFARSFPGGQKIPHLVVRYSIRQIDNLTDEKQKSVKFNPADIHQAETRRTKFWNAYETCRIALYPAFFLNFIV